MGRVSGLTRFSVFPAEGAKGQRSLILKNTDRIDEWIQEIFFSSSVKSIHLSDPIDE